MTERKSRARPRPCAALAILVVSVAAQPLAGQEPPAGRCPFVVLMGDLPLRDAVRDALERLGVPTETAEERAEAVRAGNWDLPAARCVLTGDLHRDSASGAEALHLRLVDVESVGVLARQQAVRGPRDPPFSAQLEPLVRRLLGR